MLAVREYQETGLRKRAEESGNYLELIYFYSVLGEPETIKDMRPELGARDQLAADLILRGIAGEPCLDLKDSVLAHTDSWVMYTFVKNALNHDNVADAIAVARASLKKGAASLTSLNLLVRYLSPRQPEEARQLAEASLKICPRQQDIQAVIDSDDRAITAVYLDVLPKPAPLTFYLPVYNVERYIRMAIEGILAQCYPVEELLIIDDASPDASMAIAAEYPVRVIEHPENRGLAAGRNTAFEESRTPYVAAIDTDARPDIHYARHAMMEFENADPRLAGVGGRLLEVHTDIPPDLWRAVHLSQDLGIKRLCSPGFLCGNNTVYRREVVLAAGGYNEERRSNGEDSDLSFRLLNEGHLLSFVPDAMAYHERRDDHASVLRTIWNWAYWTRHERGHYKSTESLLTGMSGILIEAATLLKGDMSSGRPQLAYLDFAYIFVNTCLDLRTAIESGLLTPAEAAYIQSTTTEAIRRFDQERGGNLGERIQKDFGEFFLAGHEPDAHPRTIVQDSVEQFLKNLDDFFENMNSTACEAIYVYSQKT